MRQIKLRNFLILWLLTMAGMVSLALVGVAISSSKALDTAVTPAPSPLVTPVQTLVTEILDNPVARISALEALYVDVFDEVSPSVVHLMVRTRSGGGTGTGFIWDDRGHIVTNNHVVENATQIFVRFADGTTVEADVIGMDEDNDLAVLQTEVAGLLVQPVSLGDSSNLRVGQLAIALGNPYGFEQTLTTGIVSALGRALPQENGYPLLQLIQTDAAINPGSSGGPLLNSDGEVIGVTTLIFSPSGSSAGVGFAVPVNTVERVVPHLIDTGSFADPWIGIQGHSISPFLPNPETYAVDQGVVIDRVVPEGPADLAGLQNGRDIILAINGSKINDMGELVVYLAEETMVGETIEITILRGDEELILPVTPIERPAQ